MATGRSSFWRKKLSRLTDHAAASGPWYGRMARAGVATLIPRAVALWASSALPQKDTCSQEATPE